MIASKNTIKIILQELTSVHENLLSLSEDIWNSIDHNDTKKLDEGVQFKKEFNRLLDNFEENSSSIASLVSQFLGLEKELKDSIQQKETKTIYRETSENKRLVVELNKEIPHKITEDFKYKKPHAFIFDGVAFANTYSFSDVYTQFISYISQTYPDKFNTLLDNPKFYSSHNKKYFSKTKEGFVRAKNINNNFYIEICLSAKQISEKIIEIIKFLGMKTFDITIYLRQDRNA